MLSVETRNWANRAICRNLDTNDFFPGRGESVNIIKVVCKACPVVKPCLEYAMRNSERFGIWGGTSERERRKMRSSKYHIIRNDGKVTVSQLLDQFGINLTILKDSELEAFSGVDGYE
jgi:WhiB family redox-sensing transcriptional regulator